MLDRMKQTVPLVFRRTQLAEPIKQGGCVTNTGFGAFSDAQNAFLQCLILPETTVNMTQNTNYN